MKERLRRPAPDLQAVHEASNAAFYAAHAPDGIALDDLLDARADQRPEAQVHAGDFGRRLVAELWFYPDGSRILELSTKCAPGEAFDVAAKAKAFLAAHGVDLAGEQQTKTKTALDFFAGELATSPPTDS